MAGERARILALLTTNLPPGVPPPTLIVDSGRGYWGFWQLPDTCTDVARIEGVNRRLANLFGALGDDCWNINRVGRLPGTVNRKTGELAAVVVDEPGRVYEIGALPAAEATAQKGREERPSVKVSGNVERLASIDVLDQWRVPDRVKVVCVQGCDPDNPKEGDNSRSAWVFDAMCQLVRCEVPDDVVYSIFTDAGFAISESILDKGSSAEKYCIRQMERAKERVAADAIDFVRNEDGKIVASNQRNIRVALHRLGVRVRHDIFRDHLLVGGLEGVGPVLDDAAMTRLWLRVDEQFCFRPAKEFFWAVVEDSARREFFHPVRDYLDSLEWDGVPRVDRWLVEHGGAEDTPYVRAVGALTLIAAARRVRQPGCKFDEMLVLESEQGTDKSSALRALAVSDDWFSDDLPLNAESQRVIEALAGHWIVEAAELKGMRKGDVEHLKAFLSRAVDRARPAYGRLLKNVPRQCVIVGTTNSSQYLRDSTGNRRFWPVKVTRFDLDALRRDRDQLWAEAAAREASGESIRLDPSLYGAAAEVQENRRVEDPYVQTLAAVLRDLNGKLSAEDAWAIVDIPSGHRTQDHNARLGEAMRELGFERTKLRFDGLPTWCYARGEKWERGRKIAVWRDASDGKMRACVDEREGVPF